MSRSTGRVISKDFSRKVLDNGKAFTASHIDEVVADNGTLSFLVTCGSKSLLVGYESVVGGDSQGRIYEAPTITENGTALNIIANNRSNINVGDCTFFHTPSVSDKGNLLAKSFIAGGNSRFTRFGGQSGLSKWIFKAGVSYYIELTNVSGASIQMSHTFNFSCGE